MLKNLEGILDIENSAFVNIIVMTESSGRYERMLGLLRRGLMGNSRSIMVHAEKKSHQEIIYIYMEYICLMDMTCILHVI